MPRPTLRTPALRTALGAALGLVVAATECGSASDDGAQATPPLTASIEGRVALGPQCPVEQVDTPCPDTPAAGVDVTVSRDAGGAAVAGEVAARAVTDTDGRFQVSVPPGSYLVTAVAGMTCDLVPARPEEAGTVDIVVTCDTGIR